MKGSVVQIVALSTAVAARTGDDDMYSAQVVLSGPGLSNSQWVQEQFAQAGFQIGPLVGVSFSISGPAALFEQFFRVQAGPGGQTLTGEALPLVTLDPALRSQIQAILSTRPPDFGPGNP